VTQQTDRLNTALEGRYRIEREIGAGGMATVYLAHDIKHDRKVAIKVLRADLAEAVGAERFLNEIKTTANLRHPHILPLYDSGAADGVLFYVMPLVEGETLRDRLAREKQLPIPDALRIANEIADALSYAHARGVVHRDIKPENVLLEGGHAVVADFGIARAVSAAGSERLTQTGTSVGTPPYMSPEQASSETDIDGRSDLYSLACVLYEMLGGQAPFTGPTAAAIVRQHLMVDAPPITNLRPAVPAHVAGALQRALAKSPADRFNPVAQFSSALQSAGTAEGAPELAAAPAMPSAQASHGARQAAAAGGSQRIWFVAAAALVLAAGVFLFRSLGSRASAGATVNNGIAVLPFSDLSADHANAYLGDGIAETLISALANVSGLTVAARTSAFSYRDKAGDVREVGRALSVATVLEGSVQRAGDKLRITAQLVKTADGVTLWSQTFDRQADDIFAVQDEVVRAVVTALQGRVLASNTALTANAGTSDREAYDLFLQGRYLWNRRSLGDFTRAQNLFEKAIARDSSFAEAWAGLADALITQGWVDTVNTATLLPRSRAAAERAMRLAPGLPDPHSTLAYLLFLQDFNIRASDSAFRDVTTRYPRNVMGHKWYVDVLQSTGRRDEGWAQLQQAIAIDPMMAITMFNIGLALHYDGKVDSALVWLNRSLESAPGLVLALQSTAGIYGSRGDSVRCLAAQERLETATTRISLPIADLRRAWGRGGYKAMLRAQIDAPRSHSMPYNRAKWQAEIGDTDGAFASLDEMLARREIHSATVSVAPELKSLHGDPRWKALLVKLGLPAAPGS